MTAPDRVMFAPTVKQLEEQLQYLQDMVLTTRMHLRVAKKAASRRQEGPMLPGIDDQPPEDRPPFPRSPEAMTEGEPDV